MGALLRLRSDTTTDIEVQQIVRVCAERQYVDAPKTKSTFVLHRIILNLIHTILRFHRELAQLAALPLQDWLAAALQAEIAKIMDSKRTAMNVS